MFAARISMRTDDDITIKRPSMLDNSAVRYGRLVWPGTGAGRYAATATPPPPPTVAGAGRNSPPTGTRGIVVHRAPAKEKGARMVPIPLDSDRRRRLGGRGRADRGYPGAAGRT